MLVWHLSAECAGQKEEYWCTGEEESGLDLKEIDGDVGKEDDARRFVVR